MRDDFAADSVAWYDNNLELAAMVLAHTVSKRTGSSVRNRDLNLLACYLRHDGSKRTKPSCSKCRSVVSASATFIPRIKTKLTASQSE